MIDPLSLADYEAHGGLAGLRRALAMDQRRDRRRSHRLAACAAAAARAFRPGSSGRPWPRPPASQKYIVCNADEGDSGTFADRMLMEGDPFTLIEGMIIAGLAVGATQGICVHSFGIPRCDRGDDRSGRRSRGPRLLGGSVLGSGQAFDMEIRVGAGAYVCGEETSLLNSLEGKRGVVRAKPPLPALQGFLGKPTVVNNVISLAIGAGDLRQGRRATTRTSGLAGRAGRSRCRSPET